MNEKKSIGHISVDAQLLYDKLATLNIGDRLGYAELSKLIGSDVQEDARGRLQTAIRKLRNDDRIVIGTVRGEGVERLDDSGIIGEGDRVIKHIGKAARRGAKIILCVKDFDGLPNDMKIKHNSRLSALGALAQMSKGSSIKSIEGKVAEKQGKIGMEETLRLFAGKE